MKNILDNFGIGIDIADIEKFKKIPYEKNKDFYKKLFNESERLTSHFMGFCPASCDVAVVCFIAPFQWCAQTTFGAQNPMSSTLGFLDAPKCF